METDRQPTSPRRPSSTPPASSASSATMWQAVCRKVDAERGHPGAPRPLRGVQGDQEGRLQGRLRRPLPAGRHRDDTPASAPAASTSWATSTSAGETWIIRDYYQRMGVEVVSDHDRRRPGGRDPPRPRRGPQRGPVLRLHDLSGGDDEGEVRHPLYPGLLFRHRGHCPRRCTTWRAHFSDRSGDPGTDPEAWSGTRCTASCPSCRRYRKTLARESGPPSTWAAPSRPSPSSRPSGTWACDVVLVGSQTGNQDDYEMLRDMCDEGTVIVDDANPLELSKFIIEKEADLLIGGVKERPIAYKMGIGFCDHNHERKIPLAGFEGMLNFAREVYATRHEPGMAVCRRRRGNRRKASGNGEAQMELQQWQEEHGRLTDGSPTQDLRCHPERLQALRAPGRRPWLFGASRGAVPLLHGSQGCSTYIRRYLISHFKEPIDIASSNFGEETAIFGGGDNLKIALEQHHAAVHARRDRRRHHLPDRDDRRRRRPCSSGNTGPCFQARNCRPSSTSPPPVTREPTWTAFTGRSGRRSTPCGEPPAAGGIAHQSLPRHGVARGPPVSKGNPGGLQASRLRSCPIIPRPWTAASGTEYQRIPEGGTRSRRSGASGRPRRASNSAAPWRKQKDRRHLSGQGIRRPLPPPRPADRHPGHRPVLRRPHGGDRTGNCPRNTSRSGAGSSTPWSTATRSSTGSGPSFTAKRTWWPGWFRFSPRSASCRCSAPRAEKAAGSKR